MDTDRVKKKAYAHWIIDGILEIGFGFMLTVVGAIRAVIHMVEDKSNEYYWLAGTLLLFMIAFGFGFNWIMKSLKRRISDPRIGFISFRKPKLNAISIIILFIFAGILGGLLGIISTLPSNQIVGIFFPIVQGLIGTIAISAVARWTGAKRLYFLAVFSAGIGLTIGLFKVGIVLGISFFYFSLGLGLMVSGALALVSFLRQHEIVDLGMDVK